MQARSVTTSSSTFNFTTFPVEAVEPIVRQPSLPASLSRPRRESGSAEQSQSAGPHWTLPAALPLNTQRVPGDAQLGERLLESMQRGFSIVQMPQVSSLALALDLYRQVLASPALQAWFSRKGLELETLTVHKDSISGYVNRGGVRTAVSFSTSDGSGWWQVSARLRQIREVLDPADTGILYLAPGEDWVSSSMILQGYGWQPPSATGDKAQLITRLRTDGLVMSPDRCQRLNSQLTHVRQAIGDLDERAWLADRLETMVKDLPDETPCDWSEQQAALSSDSTLAMGDQAAREHLQRFIQSPGLQALLKGKHLFWPEQPFRVSQGRFQHQSPQGDWLDLTGYISEVDSLNVEFNQLASRVQPFGNAVYSVPYHDVRQQLDHKGFGSPGTIGETRNVVLWLRSALPPAPALGNYAGLIVAQWLPGQLTAADISTLKAWVDERWVGESPRGLDYLRDLTVQVLQANPDQYLEKLLDSPAARALGEQLATLLKWQDSPLPKTVRQQLVIAALIVHADPQAPSKPGHVAGYNLYQPANMGRSFSAVRRDVETYLHAERHLDPKLAVLVAHIGLAQGAPELLIKDVPESIHIGTPAWVELRLGAVMADHNAPGTSRRMNEEQVSELTVLAPTSEGQATLMQLDALKILLDWAVLNGVIPAAKEGQHPMLAIKTASEAFFNQRRDVNDAMGAVTAMPARRSLAIEELLKVFPGTTATQLEKMKVVIADPDVRRNLPLSEPRTRSLVETYMTGNLTAGQWGLASDMPKLIEPPRATPFQLNRAVEMPAEKRAELDARIRRLPNLDLVLRAAVTHHQRTLQKAYAVALKLKLAELPLADRQQIENGKVELFTVRGETGLPPIEETDNDREAATGRQATLMRVEHGATVGYYQVPASGRVIRLSGLPKNLRLGDVLAGKANPMGMRGAYIKAFTGGFDLAVDFESFVKGTEPQPNTVSRVIVERLGEPITGTAPTVASADGTEVPDTYASAKTQTIVTRIANEHFYETAGGMLARARGSLPLEQQRDAIGREKAILKGLVPFVGAYQDLAAGNIGSGLFSLALDVGSLVLGAGGRARALLRAGRSLAPNPVGGVIRKMGSTVAPALPRQAWTKPVASFSDRAFDFIKESVLFSSAAMNPADGYGQLVNAGIKGAFKLKLLVSSAPELGKVAPHLITVEEKLRAYWLAGGWDAASPAANNGVFGSSQGMTFHAIKSGQHWYAAHPQTGKSFATPLPDFEPVTPLLA